MRRLIKLLSVAVIALLSLTAVGGPAQAKYPGTNGQIAFSRYDLATGEPRIFIANPDGTHQHQLLLPLPGDTKAKAGCWTRRRAFAKVRPSSNIQLLLYSLVTPSGHPAGVSCSSL
jgi:hypothetical protein